MDILEGTDTRSVIKLSFTRVEFDELINLLDFGAGVTSDDREIGGALLRFRATFEESR